MVGKMRLDSGTGAKKQPVKRAPPSSLGKDEEQSLRRWDRDAYLKECRRAGGRDLDPHREPLLFMQTDTDSYENGDASTSAIVRLFGVTKDGQSVLCRVHGFNQYFYTPAPPGIDAPKFRGALESALRKNVRASFRSSEFVTGCEVVRKRSIMYFIPEDPEVEFFKVSCSRPGFVKESRTLLLRGEVKIDGASIGELPTFEADMQYVLRFMIEAGITGCSWLELPAGKYKVAPPNERRSFAQLEVDIEWLDILAHKPEGQWLLTAPLRRLSFDIECGGLDPEKDPVFQIGNYVWEHGATNFVSKTIFTLKSCAPIVGANVFSFEKEEDMLSAWSAFVRASDPDILTGYNIIGFDLPFLLDRAQTLQIADFPFLGRIIGGKTTKRASRVSSTTFGINSFDFTIHGRVVFDMYHQIVRGNFGLRSNTLNSVSSEFLGEQKEDVHYSIMSDLQKGNEQTRRRLAVYCLKDCLLPLRLMDKLLSLTNCIESARVTGLPLNWLVSRGEMVKVVSLLRQKAHSTSLLIPDMTDRMQAESYEGGTVFEAHSGFYEDPIATLDFASLYPSIIMANNLCYSTLIRPDDLSKVPPESYKKSPSGHCFVKQSVKKGLLSSMLEELLAARKKAKKDLKLEKDVFRKMVLDGRQLALKVCANAVYGFTGANIGKLPCLEVSSSTTAYGREMIYFTKTEVESRYPGSKVIYGDTDSVMIRFGKGKPLKECMALGREAACAITELFPNPVKLEFEKCYYPYLLISKKHYAGLVWTNTEKYDRMDCKGLESERRDNCPLVANVVRSVLDAILRKGDVDQAVGIVKSIIRKLLKNEIDLSLLVVSKTLSRKEEDYKNPQPHVFVTKKMKERDASSAPSLGERVPYVIVKGKRDAPVYTRAEDPLYVLEHSIPIDNNYYVEQMLRKPLERIFGAVFKSSSEVSSLFTGDHTRSISIATPKTGGIMRFATIGLSCLGCKCPIKAGALCKSCELKEPEIYLKCLSNVRAREKEYSSLWTECQRCMGDICQDVLCSNNDCPIFYRRRKAQMDLDAASDKLARFTLEW